MKNLWKIMLLFSYKYFYSKKVFKVIHFITKIGIFGLAIGVAAIIIVLSVMNGFEDIIKQHLNQFSPTYKIIPIRGSTMYFSDQKIESLKKINKDLLVLPIIKEKCILSFNGRQEIVELKGVDSDYLNKIYKKSDFYSTNIPHLGTVESPSLVVQIPTTYRLNLDYFEHKNLPLQLYTLNKNSTSERFQDNVFVNNLNFSDVLINSSNAQELNAVYTNLNNARYIFNLNPNQYSQIEIYGSELNSNLYKNLKQLVGNNKIVSFTQENEAEFRVIEREKWIIKVLLIFICIIISFNLFGTLYMMALEKKEDLKLLWQLGSSPLKIYIIFFGQSVFITFWSIIIGLLIGYAIVGIQFYFHVVPLQGTSFVIDYYPVKINWNDLLFVIPLLFIISILNTFGPIIVIKKIINSK